MNNFAIFLVLISLTALASGDHGAEPVKIGKGVIEYDEHEGFKLSPEALKQFNFSYKKIEKAGVISIPKEAIVYALAETQVYVLEHGHYKPIDVEIVSKGKNEITVSSEELIIGAEVITRGVEFLRVITMDLDSGEEGGGHGHG